ncbi:MAG TPA: hypothetical protein VJL89_04345 [Thermodesulfovibrionia bacterium]|nr:hypothetical protein [Thermodesulfovibrionia bacterium]
MKENSGPSLETYKRALEILSIANDAAARVIEENKRLGIPSPFAIGERIFFLMPDGGVEEKKRDEEKEIGNQ